MHRQIVDELCFEPVRKVQYVNPMGTETAHPMGPETVTKAGDCRSAAFQEVELPRRCGSYKLLELIGCGGMGSVYRAVHIKLQREVALKLLHAQPGNREAFARFAREAQLVNKIRHPNIVEITDLVEMANGPTFIVMDLLRGLNLAKLLAQSAPVEQLRGIDITIQICSALAATHAVGVVHRDLKPDNIFVGPDEQQQDRITLLDFGIAKLQERSTACPNTAVGYILGTPAYMSPEQATGQPVDHRSDLYSLGVVMYELFTGQQLFAADSAREYIRCHQSQRPMPPTETPLGKHMDSRLETAILRCLDKSVSQRMESATALKAELEIIARQLRDRDGAAKEATWEATQISASPPIPTGPTPTPWPVGESIEISMDDDDDEPEVVSHSPQKLAI